MGKVNVNKACKCVKLGKQIMFEVDFFRDPNLCGACTCTITVQIKIYFLHFALSNNYFVFVAYMFNYNNFLQA